MSILVKGTSRATSCFTLQINGFCSGCKSEAVAIFVMTKLTTDMSKSSQSFEGVGMEVLCDVNATNYTCKCYCEFMNI